MTCTVKVQGADMFIEASVALQLTVVVPTIKLVPEADFADFIHQLPLSDAAEMLVKASPAVILATSARMSGSAFANCTTPWMVLVPEGGKSAAVDLNGDRPERRASERMEQMIFICFHPLLVRARRKVTGKVIPGGTWG